MVFPCVNPIQLGPSSFNSFPQCKKSSLCHHFRRNSGVYLVHFAKTLFRVEVNGLRGVEKKIIPLNVYQQNVNIYVMFCHRVYNFLYWPRSLDLP